MISKDHMKTLSKSKPTDVWCLDSLGEHSIRFDRLSLCSQIKAIPIEDVVVMLTDLQLEIEELDSRAGYDGGGMPTFSTDYIRKKKVNEIIQEKINALGGGENEHI